MSYFCGDKRPTRNCSQVAGGFALASSAVPKSLRQQVALVRMLNPQPSPSGSADGADVSAPATSGKRNPKVHKKNTRGETPLHAWAKKGDKDRCLELILEGADVNCADYAGWTPLHEACSHQGFDAAQCLIEYGAKVNVASSDGDTPLHDAATSNSIRITWLLLKHGANREARDKDHLRPVDLAEDPVVLRLLNEENLPEECPDSEEENEETDEPIASQNGMPSPGPADALPQMAHTQPPLTVSIDQDAFAAPALDSAPSQACSSSILSVAASEAPVEASDAGLDMSDVSESEESRDVDDTNTANTSPQLSPSRHMDTLAVDPRSPSPDRRGKSSEPDLGKRTAVWRQDRSESHSRAVSPHNAYEFDAEDSREEVRSECGFGGKRRGTRGRGRGGRASSGSTTPQIKKSGRGGRGGRRGRGYARVVEPSEGPSTAGEDPYDFRGTPDSETDERADDREVSVGPSVKRMRLENNEADSAAGDGEEEGEEEEGNKTTTRKVPILRISFGGKQPSEEDGDAPYPKTKHVGRGRPGGKKGADGDEDKRVTRSKVRQSGRTLADDGEGWRRKKRGRGAAANDVLESEYQDEAALVRPLPEPQYIPNLDDVPEGQRLLYERPYAGGMKLHTLLKNRWMHDLQEDKANAEKAMDNLAELQEDWATRMAPLPKEFPLLPPDMPGALLNDPEAIALWTSQQEERTKKEKSSHIDRVRLQIIYNEEFKRMKQRCDKTAPTMSVIRVMAERDTYNPMALDEKLKNREPRPRKDFDDRLASALKRLYKNESDLAECLRMMQIPEWRKMYAKRGLIASDELLLQMVPFFRHEKFLMEFPPTAHNTEPAAIS